MAEEPNKPEQEVRRQVVYESVSTSSTKSNAITMIVVIVIALTLIVWVITQMR